MPRLVCPVLPAGSFARFDQPQLEADELLLRSWVAHDVNAVVAAYSDPAIQHWHLRSMTADEAATWIASWPRRWTEETGASWAVTRDGTLVGQVSARALRLAESSAEVSYWVTPHARGHAVAPRAVETVTAWLFDTVRLHRTELAHSTRNPSSCRVAEKAGYELEGIQKQRLRHSDGWHDMHWHARINS
jgi:RimJ/RimL family protein N-acetyltransferase